MASAFGVMGSISDCRSGSASSIRLRNFGKKKGGNRKNGFTVFCVSSSSLTDPYKTLKIRHEASESETIYRLIETGDGVGEDRHEILLAIKVFKPADVSLGLSLYGVEASGALRCGLNNGGCWKQTHDGHTYSACIDDKTKGCKCPPGFKGDGINSCEDNGHPCRNSRTP